MYFNFLTLRLRQRRINAKAAMSAKPTEPPTILPMRMATLFPPLSALADPAGMHTQTHMEVSCREQLLTICGVLLCVDLQVLGA